MRNSWALCGQVRIDFPSVSVLRAVGAEAQVAVHPLPANVARARTMLVWRRGHQSAGLDALRKELS